MKKIPNFNAVSCLLDRFCVEVQKRAQFEARCLDGNTEFESKVDLQNKMISALKDQLNMALIEIFKQRCYDSLKEERTFK